VTTTEPLGASGSCDGLEPLGCLKSGDRRPHLAALGGGSDARCALWLDRRKCLLFVHAGTLYSVFVPDIRKGDVVPIGPMVVRLVTDELRAEGLPLDRFGALDPNSVDVAKTASKTVLGYMNEIGRFCEYAVADSGGLARCEVEDLNRELRRQLHLSRQPPGYFVPIKLAQASSRRRTAVQSRPSLRIVD
jgi:hypothetical protein